MKDYPDYLPNKIAELKQLTKNPNWDFEDDMAIPEECWDKIIPLVKNINFTMEYNNFQPFKSIFIFPGKDCTIHIALGFKQGEHKFCDLELDYRNLCYTIHYNKNLDEQIYGQRIKDFGSTSELVTDLIKVRWRFKNANSLDN